MLRQSKKARSDGMGPADQPGPREATGPAPETTTSAGPAVQERGPSPFAPHRHGRFYYLCDRRYLNGRRQHLIRGRCGPRRPTLYSPEVRSGLAEDLLPTLPKGSFDLVYLDPPYGTTAGDWDRAPDWELLGLEVARVLKPNGQIVLHGQGLMAAEAAVGFAKSLAYRFEIVWVKSEGYDGPVRSAILNGPAPLHAHEIIHVFRRRDSKVAGLTYHPSAMHHRGTPRGAYSRSGSVPQWGWERGPEEGADSGWRHPIDVVFTQPPRSGQLYAAKPVDLTRYLIGLLTNLGDWVLDPFAGSGTTLIAAHSIGRRALGIEASPKTWPILQRNLVGILDRTRTRGMAGIGTRGGPGDSRTRSRSERKFRWVPESLIPAYSDDSSRRQGHPRGSSSGSSTPLLRPGPNSYHSAPFRGLLSEHLEGGRNDRRARLPVL